MNLRHRRPSGATGRFAGLAVCALALLGLPIEGQAQAQDRVRDLLSGLSPHTALQIGAPGLWIQEASLEGLGADSVRVLENGTVVPIGFDEIESVSVRSGSGIKGALFGGLGGGLAGSVFGMLIGSFSCTTVDECTRDEQAGAVRWGLISLAAGAGVGYMIGSRSLHWEQIFP